MSHIWLISYLARTSMNFANLAIFQFAATRSSKGLAYESIRRLRHLCYFLIHGQYLCQSFAQSPSVTGDYLYVNKGYNVAFEFVWVFLTTLEKFCVPLTATQHFPCLLAHCLHYHLLGRHKMRPKL